MLVLHVGPHKTATTWLQANFHANRAALAKAGWLYPETGERVKIAHHDLSDAPDEILDAQSRKVRQFRKIVAAAAKRNSNILLSSEGFRNWKPQHITALKEIAKPHEMTIVYTLRDPVAVLCSFWAQQVKTGLSTSLPTFVDRHFGNLRKSRVLNPMVELDVLATIDNVGLTILAYEEIRRQNLDIADVFTDSILKAGKLPLVDLGTLNERDPIEMTEFMRLVLQRVGKWKGHETVNIGRMFRHMLTPIGKRRILTAMAAAASARRELAIERNNKRLGQVESELLSRFRDHLVPALTVERLYLDGPEIAPYYDEDALESDENVRRLADDIAEKFRPGSLRMRIAQLARNRLMHWRRFVNFFR
jgi:hypothetical protein